MVIERYKEREKQAFRRLCLFQSSFVWAEEHIDKKVQITRRYNSLLQHTIRRFSTFIFINSELYYETQLIYFLIDFPEALPF
jgi:hypothetical protein